MAGIAVVGPGALGTTLAAWLAQGDQHRVTVCARSPLDRLQVDAPGGPIAAARPVLLDPVAATPVDWVVVATKTYDIAGCLPWLDRLLGPATRVALVQNGVEHRTRLAGRMADERLVPVIAYLPAERTAPGRVLQRENGRLVVPDDEAGRVFADLFAATPIRVETVADWTSIAWRKLALNAAGAVNALTLRAAEVMDDDALAAVVRDLVGEVVAVGRAEGADLPDDLPDTIVAHMRAEARDRINSIHADRLAGRPMEVDARNGVVVRLAARHGLSAPVNRMAAALLGAVGEGR